MPEHFLHKCYLVLFILRIDGISDVLFFFYRWAGFVHSEVQSKHLREFCEEEEDKLNCAQNRLKHEEVCDNVFIFSFGVYAFSQYVGKSFLFC